MSNFKTDEVAYVSFWVHPYTGMAGFDGFYQYAYMIVLDRTKIGLPDPTDPTNQYISIYVQVAFRQPATTPVTYEDGTQSTIAKNEDVVRPYCGQQGVSGVTYPNYVPRKYLPHGCRDYIGTDDSAYIAEIRIDGAN